MTVQSLGRIDVQFHFSPHYYTDLVRQTHHISTDRWSAESALAYMDANGVAAAVMSVSTPGVDFLPVAEGVALARRLNEDAAYVVHKHPDRFGSFATLPMRDVSATLAEIEHCFDTLGMDGVCMMSNVMGTYLGDDSFTPIFDALNSRKAVVFIHPTDSADYGKLKVAPVVEWPFDTTRAAIDLIYSGTIRRCPDLKIILAHAGGALPAVAGRAIQMSPHYSTAQPPVLPEEAAAQVAGFYYDLAISAQENVIGALRGLTDMNHVLFAMDWPFAPDRAVALNVGGYERLNLTRLEREAIDHTNAAVLFPRLA